MLLERILLILLLKVRTTKQMPKNLKIKYLIT